MISYFRKDVLLKVFNMISLLKLALCLFFSYTTAQGASESSLIAALHIPGSDKSVRPVARASDTMTVKVNLVPNAIRDIDVKDREVKIDAWIYMEWEDPSKRFDAAEYGIDYLVLPPDMVWKPDVSIYSAFADYVFPSVKSNVVVYSNGTIIWVPPITVKSLCPPTENQITEDTFQCTISIGSWTYPVTMLDIQALEPEPLIRDGGESFHNIHPKWILESMTGSSEQKKYNCCKDLYSLVKYDMRFRRRPAEE